MYFDGCYFDPAYFEADPCVVPPVPTGGVYWQSWPPRRPPEDDDDEMIRLVLLL